MATSISSISASRIGSSLPERRRADDLGVDLEELAVAALLRALAAEHGADHVKLVQQAAAVQVVLDIGANDAGSGFGAEGERLRLFAGGAGTVFPGEHLLGDDVGLFADAAGEQLGGLEQRRADFVEVIVAEDLAHTGFDEVPEIGVGRQEVARTANGFNHCFSSQCQYCRAATYDLSRMGGYSRSRFRVSVRGRNYPTLANGWRTWGTWATAALNGPAAKTLLFCRRMGQTVHRARHPHRHSAEKNDEANCLAFSTFCVRRLGCARRARARRSR